MKKILMGLILSSTITAFTATNALADSTASTSVTTINASALNVASSANGTIIDTPTNDRNKNKTSEFAKAILVVTKPDAVQLVKKNGGDLNKFLNESSSGLPDAALRKTLSVTVESQTKNTNNIGGQTTSRIS